MDANERAEMHALRQRLNECQRQNTRLRAVVLHDPTCATCRIAWCDVRAKLTDIALGRQRQTLRIPPL